MTMPWFRMYHESRNDRKLDVLADDEFRVWHRLLCFASESAERGTIAADDRMLLAIEVSRGDEELLERTVKRLVQLKILTDDGQRLTFINFIKRQYDKPSDTPEATADRKRKQRQKARESAGQGRDKGVTNDVSRDVTRRHAIDTDTEEIQIQKEREKEYVSPPLAASGAPAPRQTQPARTVRNVPKPKDEPAPKNPWWDALVAGIGVTPATSDERSLYGKTVRELRDLDASPDEILRRCANYRARFPNAELTVTALTKHWSRVEHPPPEPVPMVGRNGGRPSVDELNMAEFNRIKALENSHEPDPFPGALDADWHGDEQGAPPRPLRPVVAQVRGTSR